MKILFSLLAVITAMTVTAQLKPVGYGAFHFNESPVKIGGMRETRLIVEGTTAEFDFFKVHATTQLKGAVPKPPHAQKNIEELIIIKEGTMKCTIGGKTTTLGKGSVLLIPPGEMQAFENTGNGPLTYYVFQFRSKKGMDSARSIKAGGTILINADTLAYAEKDGKGTRKYFDRPTATCERYEMHTTTLNNPGPSHAPHQHVETEVILLIEGEAEMMIDGNNFKAGAGDFFIAESGKMHGISNTGNKPCSYFAFKWK